MKSPRSAPGTPRPDFNEARYGRACLVALATLLAASLSVPTADAQALLKEMPDPARVVEDMRGSDAADTAARQYGALSVLRQHLVNRYLGQLTRREPLPAGVQATMNAYDAAMKRISRDINSRNDPEFSRRFGTLIQGDYSAVATADFTPFQKDVVAKYLSSAAIADTGGASQPAEQPSARRGVRQPGRNIGGAGIGELTVLAGIGGLVWFVWSRLGRATRRRTRKASGYQRHRDGVYEVFDVDPAGHITFNVMIGFAVFLAGLSIFGGFGNGDVLFGILTGLAAAFAFWCAFYRDLRPAEHLAKSTFRVSPESIESQGRIFTRDEIHHLEIKNGMDRNYSVVATGAGADREKYRAQVAATCYSLELETGGKAYLLAGGMDETTAKGLKHDIVRALDGVKT